MIFDPEIYCTAAETAELDGTAPLALAGNGLWVGVLSRGACLLDGVDRPGQSGDILLGPAPLVLTPQSDCHLLAVRLTGHCTDAYLLQLGAARWADGAACPGAAELIAQLCGAQTAPMAYALLCAAAKADLHGVYYANAETADTHRWALVLHGYRGDYTGALQLAAPYYEAGYQVIAPDLRACGESEGDYVGMGWLDRKDVLQWIDYIIEQDPEAKIVVHGISMGAATTMMTAGESTPDNVKAFVEDCGYTSVWDIFSSELQLRFGLPEFPILYTASGVARLRAGYSFTEASALAQVARCEKPMLFIHGTADDFIPYEMMDTLYNAKPGDNKAELTAEGAGHGEAMYALGDSYWDTVFDFIAPYMA